jgi:hypothetical protein
MADDGHIDRRRRLRRVLHGVDHARRRQEQHDDDQDRDYGPCQLDLRTPVNLRRFVTAFAAVLRNLTMEYISKRRRRRK